MKVDHDEPVVFLRETLFFTIQIMEISLLKQDCHDFKVLTH